MMWSRNELSERLNLEWPILQAPMGNISTPALAAAVSNAGGMGGIGMWGFSAEDAARRIASFRQQSGGSLNVNYPLWDDPGDVSAAGLPMRARLQGLYDEVSQGEVPQPAAGGGAVSPEHLDMLLETKPTAASFHFGLPPQEVVKALKGAGIFVLCSATTVAEARALEAAGVDAVIAQGIEAGGHRGTFLGAEVAMQPGLFALLPQVVDAVNVPVIGAGGISDGRGIAAAVMMGASGVQLGTAFLRCEEANVLDAHRAGLANGTDSNTIVTETVSGRHSRFVRNRLVDSLLEWGEDPLPFPAQMSVTLPLGAGGDPDYAALFAGQSVALTREMPAGDLIRVLAEETTRRLAEFA